MKTSDLRIPSAKDVARLGGFVPACHLKTGVILRYVIEQDRNQVKWDSSLKQQRTLAVKRENMSLIVTNKR